jgi:hypothetical protein
VEVDKMKAAEAGMLTHACKCGGTYAGIAFFFASGSVADP